MHLRTIIFTAGLALGIIVGFESPLASEIGIAALILAGAQLAVYAVGRKRDSKGIALSLFTLLFSCAIFIGVIRAQFVKERTSFVCSSSCVFEAKIISSPEKKDTYQSFVVRPLEANESMYDVQIRTPLYPTFRVGETLELSGKVSVPKFIFPHDDEKGFDYVSYLHTRNVGSEMLFPKISVIDSEAHTLRDMLGRWKEDMVSRIEMYVAQPASSLSSGMLFGNSSMSKSLTETFRTAGLSHIVVLSGFNIAIVIAFVLFVFAFIPLIARIILAFSFVGMFVLMVGGEVSVLRATAMAFIALLAQLVGRHYVARQALLISLLAIVLYEPYALLKDVSLHLSFLATAGIIYLSEPIKIFIMRFLSNRFLIELIATTIAAYFATLPYIMHVFGTVSVYGLVANVLALPIVPFAMLVSFITVVASYVSSHAALLFGYLNTALSNAIISIASLVERMPLSRFDLFISFFTMCVLYVILALVAFYMMQKKENETFRTEEGGYLTDTIKY